MTFLNSKIDPETKLVLIWFEIHMQACLILALRKNVLTPTYSLYNLYILSGMYVYVYFLIFLLRIRISDLNK